MLSRFVMLVALVALAATAHGALTHDFVLVDNSAVLPGDDPLVSDFNDGSYYSFDVLLTVSPWPGGYWDDWTESYLEAAISGPAVFFQHPAGSDVPPDPNTISQYPAVEFDSYFGPSQEIFFATPYPVNEPTFISACWFDTINMGVGTYPLVRLTVRWVGGEAAALTVRGNSVAAITQGMLFPIGPYTVTIPEPSALALLSLGAVLTLKRRH